MCFEPRYRARSPIAHGACVQSVNAFKSWRYALWLLEESDRAIRNSSMRESLNSVVGAINGATTVWDLGIKMGSGTGFDMGLKRELEQKPVHAATIERESAFCARDIKAAVQAHNSAKIRWQRAKTSAVYEFYRFYLYLCGEMLRLWLNPPISTTDKKVAHARPSWIGVVLAQDLSIFL